MLTVFDGEALGGDCYSDAFSGIRNAIACQSVVGERESTPDIADDMRAWDPDVIEG